MISFVRIRLFNLKLEVKGSLSVNLTSKANHLTIY